MLKRSVLKNLGKLSFVFLQLFLFIYLTLGHTSLPNTRALAKACHRYNNFLFVCYLKVVYRRMVWWLELICSITKWRYSTKTKCCIFFHVGRLVKSEQGVFNHDKTRAETSMTDSLIGCSQICKISASEQSWQRS